MLGAVLIGGILLQGDVPKTSLLTPLDFGAVGDGLTDDTAALQKAIDATQNGGSLFFPGGRKYLVRNLTATGEVHWFGPGGSWLNDRAADGAVIIQGDHATGDLLTLVNAAYSNVSGIAFDGNRLNQTKSCNGIRLVNCEFTRFDNIYVTSFSGHGILLENVNDLQTSDEIDFVDCYSVLNGKDGIHFDFQDGKAVSAPGDCEIIGGHYDFNFGNGIGLHVSSYTSINGANVLSNQKAGIEAVYCTGLNITGNMVRNNQHQGIVLGANAPFTNCTNCAVVDNQIHLNSRAGIARYSNLDIGYGTSHTRVIGNYAGDIHPSEKSPKSSKFGMWLHDGAKDALILGNTFSATDNVNGAFSATTDTTYVSYGNSGLADLAGPLAPSKGQQFFANGGTIGTITATPNRETWVGIKGNTGGSIWLPSPSKVTAGQDITIKDEGGGAGRNRITVVGNGAKIDGLSTAQIATNRGTLRLHFDGKAWWIF